MGANVWRDEDDWPLARAVETPWYLHADGVLSPEAPGDEPPDEYVYDPADAGAHGGRADLAARASSCRRTPGRRTSASVEERDDVLVYTSRAAGARLRGHRPADRACCTRATTRATPTSWSSSPTSIADGPLADPRRGRDPRPLPRRLRRRAARRARRGARVPHRPRGHEQHVPGRATGSASTSRRARSRASTATRTRAGRSGVDGPEDLVVAEQTIFHDTARPSHIVLPVVASVTGATTWESSPSSFPARARRRSAWAPTCWPRRPRALERYFAQAEEASGLPIKQLCLEGPIEELTATDVAQPALFCVALAMADLAFEAGLKPDFAAGHSLGEYTAAVVAGALAPEDGIRLVCARGALMAAGAGRGPGRHGGGPRAGRRKRRGAVRRRSTAASRRRTSTRRRRSSSPATWTRSTRSSRPRPEAGADKADQAEGRRRLPQRGDGARAREDGRADGRRDVLGPDDPDRLQRLRRARHDRATASARRCWRRSPARCAGWTASRRSRARASTPTWSSARAAS